MKEISKLIKDYENKLIDIEHNRKSDDKVGDHSFYMEYDTSKENINEFIGELKKLKALNIDSVVVSEAEVCQHVVDEPAAWEGVIRCAKCHEPLTLR